jgi:hypothetical protein
MKMRTVIILGAIVVSAMIAEWKFVALMTEARIVHGYHGTCNGGVGQPYADFIHQLRALAESGDTNRLVTVLRRADERSRYIYEAWLSDERGAYWPGRLSLCRWPMACNALYRSRICFV